MAQLMTGIVPARISYKLYSTIVLGNTKINLVSNTAQN